MQLMTDRVRTSRRRIHPVVMAITALTVLTAVAVIGQAILVVAFNWGYWPVGFAVGGLLLAGVAGLVLRSRRKSA
jgi:LPXTG-motif cell wall-anchored protein